MCQVLPNKYILIILNYNQFFNFAIDLTEIPVNTTEETTECLIKGLSGRAVGVRAMNAQSNKSYTIFTLFLQMMKKNDT